MTRIQITGGTGRNTDPLIPRQSVGVKFRIGGFIQPLIEGFPIGYELARIPKIYWYHSKGQTSDISIVVEMYAQSLFGIFAFSFA